MDLLKPATTPAFLRGLSSPPRFIVFSHAPDYDGSCPISRFSSSQGEDTQTLVMFTLSLILIFFLALALFKASVSRQGREAFSTDA